MTFCEEIEEKLFGLRDEGYADFQSRLMPTVEKERIIGVRMPLLRALAKEYAGRPEVYSEFFSALPHPYYEENMLHALWLIPIREEASVLTEVERFLPFVDNWATCDLLRPRAFARMASKAPTRLLEPVGKWLSSEATYTVRFGIGVLTTYFLGENFSSEFPERVAKIRTAEYYIQMMQAWYFAEAMIRHPAEVLPYFRAGLIPEPVYGMAIRKYTESFKPDDAEKDTLRTYRAKGEFSLQRATPEDEACVMALYRSAVGTPFSAWDDEYPGLREIRHDTETGNLWLLTCGERICGSFSVMPENELDGKNCWQVSGEDGAREISRVVLSPHERGKGLSRVLVGKAIGMLRERGVPAIHLSAAVKNLPAVKNYLSLGFAVRETCEMYGGTYHLCELIL